MPLLDYGCTNEEFWAWMGSCPATYEVLGTEHDGAVVAFSFPEATDDEEE